MSLNKRINTGKLLDLVFLLLQFENSALHVVCVCVCSHPVSVWDDISLQWPVLLFRHLSPWSLHSSSPVGPGASGPWSYWERCKHARTQTNSFTFWRNICNMNMLYINPFHYKILMKGKWRKKYVFIYILHIQAHLERSEVSIKA